MQITPLPRRVFDFVIDHPIIAWILLAIPSTYFVIIKIAGKQINIVDQYGNMYTGTQILFWIFIAFSLIYGLLKSYGDKYNQDVKQNGQFVMGEILGCINSVTDINSQHIINYIIKHAGQTNLSPFNDVIKPDDQINSLLENLQNAIHNICDISRDQIGIGLIIKYEKERNWKWGGKINIGDDIRLKEVINNPKSTFRAMFDKGHKTLFHADKRIAYQKGEYIRAPKDSNYNNIGSIVCRNVSVCNGKIYLNAAISISTYGKQICEDKDEEIKNMFESIILPSFESHLRLELSLLYIKSIQAKK